MTTQTRTLPVSTTGFYLVDVPEGPGPHPLLVCFHGYGESAGDHLEEVRSIPGVARWLVVAVQGLHWFYDRRREVVVASWMTMLEREQAMVNNLTYIASVLREVRGQFDVAEPVVFEGFSQGGAMAWRAAQHMAGPSAGVITHGSDLPPDVAVDIDLKQIRRALVGRGRDDAWYTAAKLEQDESVLRLAGVDLRTFVFDGGHEWTIAFRDRAGAFLEETLRALAL